MNKVKQHSKGSTWRRLLTRMLSEMKLASPLTVNSFAVLFVEGFCSSMLQKIQQIIRFRLRDVAQIPFRHDFIDIAHGSILGVLQNQTFSSTSLYGLSSLICVKGAPNLFNSCLYRESDISVQGLGAAPLKELVCLPLRRPLCENTTMSDWRDVQKPKGLFLATLIASCSCLRGAQVVLSLYQCSWQNRAVSVIYGEVRLRGN